MSRFSEILEAASERVELNELRQKLNRRQVKAAVIYLKNLLAADFCDICNGPQMVMPDGEHNCGHCLKLPVGWGCTRELGHKGPCAPYRIK